MQNVFLLGRKLFQLEAAELVLLFRAFARVCLAACTVHLLPNSVLRSTLQSLNQMQREPQSRQVPLEQLACAVNRASRVVPGASCLTRAIAACQLMRQAGYPVRVRFGIPQLDSNSFGAHCWVEVDGLPVFGSAEGCEAL